MHGGEDGNINAISGHPKTPTQAWQTLMAGNARFVEASSSHPNQDAARRSSLVSTQHPFVMIFGCSDSRLAAEIIFDLGLGDAFVVRTLLVPCMLTLLGATARWPAKPPPGGPSVDLAPAGRAAA